MSRYFARLVERASGATAKAQVARPARSIPAASDTSDPFETALPDTPAARPAAAIPPRAEGPLAAARKSGEPVSPVRPQETLKTPKSSSHSDQPARPEPAKLKPLPSPPAAPVTPPDRASPEMIEQPPMLEHTRMEPEGVRQSMAPAPVPSAAPEAPARLVPEKPAAQAVTPFVSPEPVEVPRPRADPEPRVRLEPAKTAPVAPTAPAPAPEPRLVIGRLNVEVVPVAPVRAQPTPVAAPSRPSSRRTSSPAHLPFGLGQM